MQSGGGAVYTHSNDSIIRIDNSDDFKLQFSSYLYVKDDTIFNMGGTDILIITIKFYFLMRIEIMSGFFMKLKTIFLTLLMFFKLP